MDWEREAKPLLKAVGRAIDANEGERVSAESVNAQLPQPLDDALLDRRLGELHRAQLLDGQDAATSRAHPPRPVGQGPPAGLGMAG